MFTKKPLGGFSCASCEKNIVNLEGVQAEFLPWKRLPFKESCDRISKYGPGFSKILSMLRPEHRSIDDPTLPNEITSSLKKSTTIDEETEHLQKHHYNISSVSPQSTQQNFRPQKLEPVLPKSVTAQKMSRTQANFYSEGKSASLGVIGQHKSDDGGWGTTT